MPRALIALSVVLTFASCAGDGSAGEGAQPDARAPTRTVDEGDWFVCANEACTELQTQGLRFSNHQAWHLIAAEQADGHFTEGEPYCVGHRFGSYEHDAGVLTLTFHDGGLSVESDFVIDDAGLTAHDGDMHKVKENATGRWVDDVCVSD